MRTLNHNTCVASQSTELVVDVHKSFDSLNRGTCVVFIKPLITALYFMLQCSLCDS